MNSSLSFYYMICILVRTSIAYAAYLSYNSVWRYILVAFFSPHLPVSLICILPSNERGGFGQKVWWDSLRPIHATLLFISGVLLSLKMKETYLVLLADAFVGFIVRFTHKYLLLATLFP